MPFLTVPKGSPAPSVADFAGMPMDAVEAAGPIKGLVDLYKGAWQSIRPELKGLDNIQSALGFGKAAAEAPDPAPAVRGLQNSYASVRQPKAGGVLDDVLSRAGLKQATGEAPTPGEGRLLNHFGGMLR